MMKRLAELKEIAHSLGRARGLAEQNNLIHLANTLTHNIGVLHAEILVLESQQAPKAPPAPKPRRTSKALGDNLENQTEEAK